MSSYIKKTNQKLVPRRVPLHLGDISDRAGVKGIKHLITEEAGLCVTIALLWQTFGSHFRILAIK
jgi:hypothetical protein